MIEFHFETGFQLENKTQYVDWISRILTSENFGMSEINFIFCDDAYLLKINLEYLKHNTYTDIITFDYTENDLVGGDVFISIDRVRENAEQFKESFENELRRVMAHGILHLMGYNDKSKEEVVLMRSKENEKIILFHVEQ